MKKIFAVLLALALCLSLTFANALTVSQLNALTYLGTEDNTLYLYLPSGWNYKVSEDGIVKVQSEEIAVDGVKVITLVSAVDGDKEAQIVMGEDLTAENCPVCNFSIEGGVITGSECFVQQSELEDGQFTVDADGKTITVKLAGNPTTGYEWTYIPDNSGVLELVSEEYIPDEAAEGMVGVGGTYVFVLAVAENPVGTETAPMFTYGRSWEEKPAEEYTLNIGINENHQISFAESIIYVW